MRTNRSFYTVGADTAPESEKPAANGTNDGNGLPKTIPFLNQRMVANIENKYILLGIAGVLLLIKMKR